ncbi:hypothetical protein REPUB_Repub18cG0100400 [Reevesia pubescens]
MKLNNDVSVRRTMVMEKSFVKWIVVMTFTSIALNRFCRRIHASFAKRQIANILDCTTWTRAGPGLMDAAIKGSLQAVKPVGGFFSARKHGLVDAAVRSSNSDKTAVVALLGGVGTLDEMFEILALIQLERIGLELPVPFIVMNYDSFYSKLLRLS